MRPRVLVVDDKPNFLSLMVKVLGHEAEVVTARGVQEALRILLVHPPTVVVCDLRMPDGDGLDVLRALRAAGNAAPFLLMTAYGTVPTAVQAMREGAWDYVTKPFDPDELLALVLQAVSGVGVTEKIERLAPAPTEVATPPPNAGARPLVAMTYREAVDVVRDEGVRRYLEAVLEQHRGNVTAAARHAGVERESFHRLLRRHGLRAEGFRDEGHDGGDAPKGEGR